MLKFENKNLNEYYLKKLVEHLVYSSNIREDFKKYNVDGFLFSDEFFEAFETEIKLQAYNQVIDEQSRNNILKIITFIKENTDSELRRFVLEELIEEVLTSEKKECVEYYRFQLKRRLGETSYAKKTSDRDIKLRTDEIRKSIYNDFIVLDGLLSNQLQINGSNAHYVLDSLNVIKIECPKAIVRSRRYITDLLTNYRQSISLSQLSNCLEENTLNDLHYSKTRGRELIKIIEKM